MHLYVKVIIMKKILIAHRGNLIGPNLILENSPLYIDDAIRKGYDVEIDIWMNNDELFLGHDEPKYKISLEWIIDRTSHIWIHCKNIAAFVLFNSNKNFLFNYFWHENDTLTLTSAGYIWVYPGKQPVLNSIAVLPKLNTDDVSHCLGICSDYISDYG